MQREKGRCDGDNIFKEFTFPKIVRYSCRRGRKTDYSRQRQFLKPFTHPDQPLWHSDVRGVTHSDRLDTGFVDHTRKQEQKLNLLLKSGGSGHFFGELGRCKLQLVRTVNFVRVQTQRCSKRTLVATKIPHKNLSTTSNYKNKRNLVFVQSRDTSRIFHPHPSSRCKFHINLSTTSNYKNK